MKVNNKTTQNLLWGIVLTIAITSFFYELGKDVAQLHKKEPKTIVVPNK